MVDTLDPYLAHYVYVKQNDPKAPIVWRQFRQKDVKRVDRIVEMAQGNRDAVTSQKDWEILGELLKFFSEEWPDEFNSFKASIPDIRSSRREGGYGEKHQVMYLAALPPRFERMIKSIFPSQQFDKKFIYRLIRKFPIFRIAGVNNMSKGRAII
jgi:hypothetical protein